MEKPKKIVLKEKELLQLGSDLYIYQEGKGMCQNGAITIIQSVDFNEWSLIRFHKKDLNNLIKALKDKLPIMTEENSEDFRDNIEELKEEVGE